MKIPRTPDEVDDEWIIKYLTDYEKRKNPNTEIKVSNIHKENFEDATEKRDSYQGDIYRLKVKACVADNKESKDVEYNHIFKFTTQDPIQKEFNKVFTNPERETLFLSEIIGKLNAFQEKRADNKFPIHLPEHVYVEGNDEGLVLVKKDMKKEDYYKKSRADLLTFEEAKIALEQLARLHGISYRYFKTKESPKGKNEGTEKGEEKDKGKTKEKIKEKNKQKSKFSVENTSNLFISCHEHFIDIVLEFLDEHEGHKELVEKKKVKRQRDQEDEDTTTITKKEENKHKDLIEKIKSSRSHISEKNKEAFPKKYGLMQKILCKSPSDKKKIFCLNHGDPWSNNILFGKQPDNEVNAYFTDWENVHWNTPAYDLNYFFAGALTPELRQKHLEELLKHYYDHFIEVTKAICKDKNGEGKIIWTYENFRDDFDEAAYWGFLKSLRFSMTLSEVGKDIKTVNKKPRARCCSCTNGCLNCCTNGCTNNILTRKINECDLWMTKNVGRVMVKVMNIHGFILDKFTYKIMKKYTEPVLEELLNVPKEKNNQQENVENENNQQEINQQEINQQESSQQKLSKLLYERFLATILEGEARGFFKSPEEEDTPSNDNNQGNGIDNPAAEIQEEEDTHL